MNTNNLKFFAPFTEHKTKLFETRMFYVYYIGSPTLYSHAAYKNLFQFPVYIVELDTTTEELKGTHLFQVDWSALHHFYIGQYIHADGGYQRIENTDESYKQPIQKKKLMIPDPLTFRVRKLKDFISDTDGTYFQYLHKITSIQNDLIYTYADENGIALHIPAMELLRHFYIDSREDTFLKHILSPDAFTRGKLYHVLAPTLPIPTGYSEAYRLELARDCKKGDVDKLFYFLYTPRYKRLFNDVWSEWNYSKTIHAPIPSDNPILINARYFENKHGRLIFNIFQSNLIDYDKPIHVEFEHPNDFSLKDDFLKVDPLYDSHQNIATPTLNVNTKTKANPSSARFPVYREEKLYDGIFVPRGITTIAKEAGKQIDRGGKIITHTVPDDILTTLIDDRKGGTGVGIKTINIPEKPALPPKTVMASPSTANNIDKIAQQIKDLGHTVEGPISYFFREPDCKKSKKKPGITSEPCNKTEAYINLSAGIRRKYTIFKVSTIDGKTFFCLDVEPKREAKHLLVLFSVMDFTAYVNNVIDDLVFEQVRLGSHLWLRDGIPPNYTTDFKRIPHIGDAEKMSSKIIDIASK